MADAAVGTNAFLGGVSLIPMPGIDGGPILKWTLVKRGRSVEQADETVRRVNAPLAAALGLGSLVTLKRRRWFLGGVLALLAASAYGIARGLIKE